MGNLAVISKMLFPKINPLPFWYIDFHEPLSTFVEKQDNTPGTEWGTISFLCYSVVSCWDLFKLGIKREGEEKLKASIHINRKQGIFLMTTKCALEAEVTTHEMQSIEEISGDLSHSKETLKFEFKYF